MFSLLSGIQYSIGTENHHMFYKMIKKYKSLVEDLTYIIESAYEISRFWGSGCCLRASFISLVAKMFIHGVNHSTM